MRLIPGEDRDAIDVLVIACALTADKKDILGIQARFRGKAYDVTWLSETAAVRAASSGLQVGDRHFDVLVFVACKFPDEYLLELLKQYGTFDASNIRHMLLKEPGFQHIENRICVIKFTELHRDLPSTFVYRNTPMGFRYTGQPKVCFKCASPDHMVRDCPQKLNTTQETTPEQEHTEEKTDTEDNSDAESITSSLSEESDMETCQTSPPDTPVKRPKHPRLDTPTTSDHEQPPTPASQQNIAPATTPTQPSETPEIQPDETLSAPSSTTSSTSQTSTANCTQELFPATQDSSSATSQQTMDKPSGPRMKKFLEAISTSGPARQKLMTILKPGRFCRSAPLVC